jgi:hypothetical protein
LGEILGAFLFREVGMTKQEKKVYQDTEVLRDIIKGLKGEKFNLDCGHRVTFGVYLGNDISIHNGKEPKIICSQCGY